MALPQTLPEREARCLVAQIFSGLRYLAARRIIHYDLKPANILFDGLGAAKIADFGLSKVRKAECCYRCRSHNLWLELRFERQPISCSTDCDTAIR